MGTFDEFGQPLVGFNKVFPITLGMRRSETNALQPFDFAYRLDQLHKGRFSIACRNIPLAVACDNLAQQSDFPDSAPGQFTAFLDNVGDAPASLFAARVRDNAKGAILI